MLELYRSRRSQNIGVRMFVSSLLLLIFSPRLPMDYHPFSSSSLVPSPTLFAVVMSLSLNQLHEYCKKGHKEISKSAPLKLTGESP